MRFGDYVVVACVAFIVGVSIIGIMEGSPPVYDYTRLRQEMMSEIATLKSRIVSLESACPSGPIKIYHVDTAAGTITCRSCEYKEDQKP